MLHDITPQTICYYYSNNRAPSPPEDDEPSEERDKRTVMCMQLAARVGKHELEEFFASLGKKVS